jgi:hypothetical protein
MDEGERGATMSDERQAMRDRLRKFIDSAPQDDLADFVVAFAESEVARLSQPAPAQDRAARVVYAKAASPSDAVDAVLVSDFWDTVEDAPCEGIDGDTYRCEVTSERAGKDGT